MNKGNLKTNFGRVILGGAVGIIVFEGFSILGFVMEKFNGTFILWQWGEVWATTIVVGIFGFLA